MHKNLFHTPLRYPGGKAKFAPFVARLIELNDLTSGHYLEPYAGGAAVALKLLFDGQTTHIHINDYDPAIYDFWVAVTKYPEEILKLLNDTPVTMEQWYYWREILQEKIQTSQVERGFATLFMNRTNRSGILKGGVIGGLEQAGSYRLDARFNKKTLAKRIEKIAMHSSSISVHNEDAFALLSKCHNILPENSLIYLDPPYYVKGKGLYRNFYEHDDHEEIATLLQDKSFNHSWMVSYDNVDEIRQMYSLSRTLSYGLNYTAQKRYVGSEIMFFSKGMRVPRGRLPTVSLSA